VGLIHGVEYARMYAREHRQAAELREQLALAQLDQLRARLQPHFLFNTLNGIAVLFKDEPERARQMLLQLSELLRAVVSENEQMVPLRREMSLVERYLDLQQMRFGDRLRLAIDLPAHMADELVPHFLIQPIVENAVKHGVSRAERGGSVAIRVLRDQTHLSIEVEDRPEGAVDQSINSTGAGTGLSTTRERLDRLYGDRYRLSMRREQEGGT